MTPQERAALQRAARDRYERECGDERDRFRLEFEATHRRRRAIEAKYAAEMDGIAAKYAAEMEPRADALAHEREVTTV